MLIYAATEPQTTTTRIRPRFTFSYAYPEWLEDHHRRIVASIDRFHLIDTNQLIRLTGYQERRTQKLTKMLEAKNYIRLFKRNAWARDDKQSYIWGLLPRGAWLRSLETKTHFDTYRTYQDDPPAPMTAEHAIDLSDIRISFELQAPLAGVEIAVWRDEPGWRRGDPLTVSEMNPIGHTTKHQFRPDGSVTLKNREGHTSYVFIEADRTNRNNWPAKIRAYKALWSSGTFHKLFGVTDLETGFRVLVTTRSHERANHLIAQAETVGRKELASLFLFAPIATVATTANVFTSPIWARGGIGAGQSLYQPTTTNVAANPVLNLSESMQMINRPLVDDCLPIPTYQLSLETL